jgi:hypothetical protein
MQRQSPDKTLCRRPDSLSLDWELLAEAYPIAWKLSEFHDTTGDVPVQAPSITPPDPQTNEAESPMKPWPICEKDIECALRRNRLAGEFAANAAVRLLPYARIIALQLGASERGLTISPSSKIPPLPSSLPFELKTLILNELAPSLSLKQSHRVVQYVS